MKAKIKQLISDILDVPVADISDNANPDNTENWDSINHLNIITALEEEFDVFFTEEEMIELMSLENIIAALADKL